MNTDTVVVIPTYNSKKSIVTLVKKILKYLPSGKVIVVDDNSPDETTKEVKKYFPSDKRIKIIIRKQKNGRGSAVLAGFAEGLKDKNNRYFIEMDSDLCHNPKYIPDMVKKCKKYDVVIASKYLKSSKVIGLPLKRRLFSKIVNLFIRFILKVPITDYTNGFRCYGRDVLEKIDFNNIKSKGFIVLSEMAFILNKKSLTFKEIPFVFNFKEINPSNFDFDEIKEAFLTILKLRFSR